MSTITREWLKQTISELEQERDATPGVVNEDAVMALEAMRIALASIEAKPVAYIGERMLDSLTDGARSCGRVWPVVTDEISGERRIPLYTAPPAPVSVQTFDEWLEIRGNKPLGWVKDAMRESYDACRAAMQGKAEPVSQPYKLPDGWVAVPIELTVAMRKAFHKANDECEQYVSPDHQWEAMLAAAPQQEVK